MDKYGNGIDILIKCENRNSELAMALVYQFQN